MLHAVAPQRGIIADMPTPPPDASALDQLDPLDPLVCFQLAADHADPDRLRRVPTEAWRAWGRSVTAEKLHRQFLWWNPFDEVGSRSPAQQWRFWSLVMTYDLLHQVMGEVVAEALRLVAQATATWAVPLLTGSRPWGPDAPWLAQVVGIQGAPHNRPPGLPARQVRLLTRYAPPGSAVARTLVRVVLEAALSDARVHDYGFEDRPWSGLSPVEAVLPAMTPEEAWATFLVMGQWCIYFNAYRDNFHRHLRRWGHRLVDRMGPERAASILPRWLVLEEWSEADEQALDTTRLPIRDPPLLDGFEQTDAQLRIYLGACRYPNGIVDVEKFTFGPNAHRVFSLLLPAGADHPGVQAWAKAVAHHGDERRARRTARRILAMTTPPSP